MRMNLRLSLSRSQREVNAVEGIFCMDLVFGVPWSRSLSVLKFHLLEEAAEAICSKKQLKCLSQTPSLHALCHMFAFHNQISSKFQDPDILSYLLSINRARALLILLLNTCAARLNSNIQLAMN